MKNNLYTEYCYPAEDFVVDQTIQDALTSRMKRRDKITISAFVGFIVAFAIAAISLFLGFVWAIAIIPLSIVPLLVFIPSLFTPKYICSECGKKMKQKWERISLTEARNGKFLVCESCKRFAYTHLAQRP